MSLYSAGRTTGLVIESGAGLTHSVPVFEGFAITHAIQTNEIAGAALNTYLQKLLIDMKYMMIIFESTNLRKLKCVNESITKQLNTKSF